MLKLMGNVRLN